MTRLFSSLLPQNYPHITPEKQIPNSLVRNTKGLRKGDDLLVEAKRRMAPHHMATTSLLADEIVCRIASRSIPSPNGSTGHDEGISSDVVA